jgi:hypothetical protein
LRVVGPTLSHERVVERTPPRALFDTGEHQARCLARDPDAASLVAEHPAPPSTLRLASVSASGISDGASAGDERYP